MEQAERQLAYFHEARDRVNEDRTMATEFRDSLLAADNPREILKTAFELLGHTGDVYVSDKDHIVLRELADGIANGDSALAESAVAVLMDIGFDRLLARADIRDAYFGARVGLECNRRKNVGGTAFKMLLEPELNRIVAGILPNVGEVTLVEEERIGYGKLSKKVDFALLRDDHPIVGIELNFYTTAGSKPTEIKRSYGEVTRQLKSVGVELVWITDGAGYGQMKRSLADAFRIFPNVYNLAMVREHLADDLNEFLRNT